jgi:hypothetical protein
MKASFNYTLQLAEEQWLMPVLTNHIMKVVPMKENNNIGKLK